MEPPDVRLWGENAPNSISVGALPQTRWGSLQHSPDLLAVFRRPSGLPQRGRRRTGREEGEGRKRDRRVKEKVGRDSPKLGSLERRRARRGAWVGTFLFSTLSSALPFWHLVKVQYWNRDIENYTSRKNLYRLLVYVPGKWKTSIVRLEQRVNLCWETAKLKYNTR